MCETRLKYAAGIAMVQVDSRKMTYKEMVPDRFLNDMHYELYENRFKELFLEKDSVSSFVATDSNHHVEGFKSGGENRLRENDCELHTICLVEDYQGKQIGSKLIKKLTEALDKQNYHKMIVQVLTGNAAKKFYEKTGAKYLDSSRISILGKVLEKSVYSWENIKQIMNSK